MRSHSGVIAAAAWSPEDVPGFASAPLVAAARLAGGLWQNAGKTTPATADGDLVRVLTDPFTGVDWTAPADSNRMTLKDLTNDKWGLATADGSTKYLVCGTPTTLSGEFSYYAAITNTSGGGTITLFGNTTTATLLIFTSGLVIVANDPNSGGGISHALPIPESSYIVRLRRDASNVVYVQLNNETEITIGTLGGNITPDELWKSSLGLNTNTSFRFVGHVLIDSHVGASDDAAMITYMEKLLDVATAGTIDGDAWILRPSPLPAPTGVLTPHGGPLVIYCHGATVDQTYLETYPQHADTVAALYAAGYMIAAGGFASENWGNQAGLDAMYALYAYLVAREQPTRVIFWGESMGGLLAQLALTDPRFAIAKGAYLTVPVCDIPTMYAQFGAPIETAYGFSGESNMAAAIVGHNPVDLDGADFVGKRLRYVGSYDDTIVIQETNYDVMLANLAGHATEASLRQASGEHGAAAQFDPADIVAFFDRCV